MNEIVTLGSGAKLELQDAGLLLANRLRIAIMAEVEKIPLELELGGLDKIDGKTEIGLGDLSSKDLNTIKNLIFHLASCAAIEDAIWACLEGSTYADTRFDRTETFKQRETRGDYLEVCWEVIRYNVGPFFKNRKFASLLKKKPSASDQKSSTP